MAMISNNDRQEQPRVKWPKLLPLVITGLAVLLLGYVLIEALERLWIVIASVFVPLLISVALAFLLEPVVERFESYKLSRNLSTLLTMLVAGLVLILSLIFIVPSFWTQLSYIAVKLPESIKSLANWSQARLALVQQYNPGLYEKISAQINDYIHNPTGVTEPIMNIMKNSIATVGGITASVLNLILIPMFVYYILVDFKRLAHILREAVPLRHRGTASDLFLQVDAVLRNFVRGQLLVCLAMSGLYVIGFVPLGVPMGFTLGILSGLANLIPYLGTAAAALIVIGFTALDSPEWWRVLAVAGMFPLVQTIEGFVLTPRILGEKLDLHPFLVLIGVIIGQDLFGILGIILAAPAIACAKVFITFFYRRYLNSSFYLRIPSPSAPSPQPAQVDLAVETVESRPSHD
jgi:predicted PurR-regulated permease PerM